MRFAYLILAHDAFDQLERLVERLLVDGPEDRVFIHVDAKAAIPGDFLAALSSEAKGRVAVLEQRVRVYWAHHSQCVATCALLDAALAEPTDFVHLLSGRDWPFASRATIARDITQADGRDCFVAIEGMDYRWRMDGYRFGDRMLGNQRSASGWRYKRVMGALSACFNALSGPRSMPYGAWVKGSQWWSLPRDAALHARDALRSTLDSGRLRYTQCADEHVVQTALVHSHFRERITPNRRFIRWPDGASSPAVLTGADLAEADGHWFARKFDAEIDGAFYRV